MGNIDPAKLLSYGAVGLGFLLAFLSYLLLSAEQKRSEEPRPKMIQSIYSFMLFSLLISFLGFGSEILKSGVGKAGNPNAVSFSHRIPVLRSPSDRAELSNYPRELTLSWEEVPDAAYYRVETQIQVSIESEHRTQWVDLPPQQVSTTHCQITFGGATWGRWRVTAIDAVGNISEQSEWWTFHYTV
jgi:hypothetical protein